MIGPGITKKVVYAIEYLYIVNWKELSSPAKNFDSFNDSQILITKRHVTTLSIGYFFLKRVKNIQENLLKTKAPKM